MSKTLSVIIPAYNEENTVRLILDEVLNLELPEMSLELVVVNDCSTDGTEGIIREYMETHRAYPIHYFKQEKKTVLLKKIIKIRFHFKMYAVDIGK